MDKPQTYNVIVSDRAVKMLTTHIRFLANVSPPAARKAEAALTGAMRSLADMPERHPFLSEAHIPPDTYRRMFVEKWYLLLYQIRDDTVFVEYIVDCRQDYGWLAQ